MIEFNSNKQDDKKETVQPVLQNIPESEVILTSPDQEDVTEDVQEYVQGSIDEAGTDLEPIYEKKKKPGFFDFWSIANRQKDINIRLNVLVDNFEKIETMMNVRGIKTDSQDFYLPILSPQRRTTRDLLIQEYNQNNPDKPKIPTSSEIIENLESVLLAPLTQGKDFENLNTLDKAERFISLLGYSVVTGAIDHPYITIASFLGGGVAVSSLSSVFGSIIPWQTVSSALANGTFAGIVSATMGLVDTNKENKVNELIGREKIDVWSKAGEDLLVGTLIGGGLTLTAKGIKEFSKLTYGKIRSLRKSPEFNASPEFRAAVYDEIKRYSPSETMDINNRAIFEKDQKDIAKAIINNDRNEIDKIMQRDGAKQIIPRKNMLESFAERDINITQEPINKLNEINNFEPKLLIEGIQSENIKRYIRESGYRGSEIPLSDFAKIAGERAYRITKKLQAKSELPNITTQEFNEAKQKAAKSINTLTKQTSELLLQPTPLTKKYITKSNQRIRSGLKSFWQSGNASKINFADILTDSITENQLVSLDKERRSALLKVIAQVKRARVTEVMLNIAETSSDKKIPLGKAIVYTNTRNTINALLEQARKEFNFDLSKLTEEVLGAIQKAKKTNGANLKSIDVRELADAMLNPKQSGVSNTEANIARIIKKWSFQQHNKLLNQGINISWAEEYMPNMWDPNKIVKYKSSEFASDMLGFVDEKKMLAIFKERGAPIKNMYTFLETMHSNIVKDRSPRIYKLGQNDIINTGDRSVIIKDGTSWLQAHEKYGKSTKTEDVISSIINTYRQKNNQAVTGLASADSINSFITETFDALKSIAKERFLKPTGSNKKYNSIIKSLTEGAEEFKNVLTEFSGFGLSRNVHPMLSSITHFYKKAATSMSFVTSLFGDAITSMKIQKNITGIKRQSPLFGLDKLLSKASRRELEEVLGIARFMNNQALSHINSSIPSKLFLKTISFPKTLLEGTSKISNIRAQLSYTHYLATQRKRAFNNLSNQLRSFFSKNGITAKDWDAYRSLPTYKLNNSTNVMSSNYLKNQGMLKDGRIYKLFATAERQAMLIGAPESTAFGRIGSIRSENTGPLMYLTSELIFPFANITRTLLDYHYVSLVELAYAKQWDAVATSLIATIMGGYTIYMAKNLLRGNKVEFNNKSLANALLHAGFFGPAVEDILSHIAWGQQKNLPEQIMDTLSKGLTFRGMHNLINQFNPYRNFSVAGDLLMKYTSDQLFKLIDPEGAEQYELMLRNKLDNEQITEWKAKILGIID